MRLSILLALVTIVFVIGCIGPGENCTLEARASVNVEVKDEAGDAVDDVTVTYSVDDGAVVPCEAAASPETWACGYELAGDFTITVASEGFITQERAVTVGQDDDGCHVTASSITVTLLPAI